MNCEQAGERISELCDGERIPREAAEHIGACQVCRERLTEYAAIGSELRRLASLDESAVPGQPQRDESPLKIFGWWRKGLRTMRIPRLAFGLMLTAIIGLSGGLVLARARAGSSDGRFFELKLKTPPTGRADICMWKMVADQKGTCTFVDDFRGGLLLMNSRPIAKVGDAVQLGIRAKYLPGPHDNEFNYSALLKDVPEKVFLVEPGETQDFEVAGLGTIEVEGKYLDHVPSLVYRPQETLDPNPKEFRIVTPVLVRDKEVIASMDGSSIDTGSPDPTLMLYVPGEGRYLVSIVPFEGAVEGNVHLGQIAFSLDGHDYRLLTSMPIMVSTHVWVKHEPDFKASERMVRQSEARDDQPMFLVRSLKTLQQPRIEH